MIRRLFSGTPELAQGDATQIHYTHGVRKTRALIGERISLAFRVKPDQQRPHASGDSGVYR